AVLADELMDRPYVGRFHYARHDRGVTPFDKGTLVRSLVSTAPATLGGVTVDHISDQDGVKYIFADNSWLLIRPSGTEPVLRVYAEAGSEAQVHALLEEGGALAERQLGALVG
ncbi:MAG: phosphoglucomutase/phosphomannomutase family protein, partial [Caldilineaceae bacterium]|nr:phosphoglucomutase/phosphomannomutase family protein [Caldilineaceae bacterium]